MRIFLCYFRGTGCFFPQPRSPPSFMLYVACLLLPTSYHTFGSSRLILHYFVSFVVVPFCLYAPFCICFADTCCPGFLSIDELLFFHTRITHVLYRLSSFDSYTKQTTAENGISYDVYLVSLYFFRGFVPTPTQKETSQPHPPPSELVASAFLLRHLLFPYRCISL